MKKAILIVLILIVSGCANYAKEPSLIEAFENYNNNATIDNISKDWELYFSSSLIDDQDIKDEEIVNQLLFKNYMKTIMTHHELMGKDSGCLTVNGIDQEGLPIAFNLQYLSINNKWLISDIHIIFADNLKQISSTDKCHKFFLQ